MPKKRHCCLCDQIGGRPANDLIARLLPEAPYVRRVMIESASFAVLPSLGALVGGHSLLCPKTHIRSLAHLDSGLYREFDDIKTRLIHALRRLYGGQVHLFEHGMAARGNHIVCTVEHAHLHFLPIPGAVRIDAPAFRDAVSFDGSAETLRRLSRGREYLSYESPEGVCRILTSEEGHFEPQYMRKLFAAALGKPGKWNWRTDPDARAADDAWRRFNEAEL